MSEFQPGPKAIIEAFAAKRRREYQSEMNWEPWWPDASVTFIGEVLSPFEHILCKRANFHIGRIMSIQPKKI